MSEAKRIYPSDLEGTQEVKKEGGDQDTANKNKVEALEIQAITSANKFSKDGVESIPTETENWDLPPGIDHKQIMTMVYVQFIAQLFLMIDNGFLPAISVKYKKEQKMSDSFFGMLGSMVFAG